MSQSRVNLAASTSRVPYTLAMALIGLSGVGATAAAAQDIVTPPNATADRGEEIVVTGSRISRRDYVSPTPIVTTSADTLAQTGKVTLEQSLGQLPQFAPASNEADNGGAFGGAGIATVNLRGLGANRTLVLLDGRRLGPANGQLVIDINTVPQSIVENVEVITGGASAVYGSDAVSGVVNIKTKRLHGLNLQGDYGATTHGDAQRYSLNAAAGSKFADDRGYTKSH